MAQDIEISTLDLSYESYRMKNPALEGRLLASIMERGIDEPLEGMEVEGRRVLLNGFKRYRCARKLGIGCVPYVSLGTDEVTGILAVIRASSHRSLSILEQARFIDELHGRHKMSVVEIAETLSRSKAWVTMRLGLIDEMSETVREKVFSGAFPVYSYMYTMRRFMRMNGEGRKDVDQFVEAVSGRKLSIREVEHLAQGYFRGPAWFREEVKGGHFALALERMRKVPEERDECSEFERLLLRDLDLLGKYMQRVMSKGHDRRLQSRAFHAQANLLLSGILSRITEWTQSMRDLHDRTSQA